VVDAGGSAVVAAVRWVAGAAVLFGGGLLWRRLGRLVFCPCFFRIEG